VEVFNEFPTSSLPPFLPPYLLDVSSVELVILQSDEDEGVAREDFLRGLGGLGREGGGAEDNLKEGGREEGIRVSQNEVEKKRQRGREGGKKRRREGTYLRGGAKLAGQALKHDVVGGGVLGGAACMC